MIPRVARISHANNRLLALYPGYAEAFADRTFAPEESFLTNADALPAFGVKRPAECLHNPPQTLGLPGFKDGCWQCFELARAFAYIKDGEELSHASV